ncbi:hypothetical protein QUF80_17470 [Desulfococcaceae bacterium HSG8]|nr:hypothetical protein [Desulfococcaceae bacterium HSG8]
MALDEPKETDDVYDVEGFKYLVDKNFMDKIKPIKVDFLDVGFKVTSGIDFGSACGGCETTRSCCS